MADSTAEWLKTKVESPGVPPTTEIANKECCVRKFEYPECWYPISIVDKDKVLTLGLHFRAHAEYIPTGDDAACACECCEFRQYVEVDYNFTWSPTAGKTKLPVEDCVVTTDLTDEKGETVKKDGVAVRDTSALPQVRARNASSTWTDFMAGLGNPVFECTVHRAKPGPSERYESDPSTSCKYWYVDEPKITVALGGIKNKNWFWKTTFIGRVVDICHKDAPRAEGRFAFEMNIFSVAEMMKDPDKTPAFTGGPPSDKQVTDPEKRKECG